MAKGKKNKPAEDMVQEAMPQQDMVEFDSWWALRGPSIPMHHHKEIIKADFGSRGLSKMATMEDFDSALRQYGVRI